MQLSDRNGKFDVKKQKQFADLLRSIYGLYRNRAAHDSPDEFEVDSESALELLSMLTMVHKTLDTSYATASPP